MEGWQAAIFLHAQAQLVIVEGMKAENSNRERRGEAQAYSEDDFYSIGFHIDTLANSMKE